MTSLESIPVSVVVIAKNEETNIGRCLELLKWCNDVVVVDDHSEDQTVEIAKHLSARVVTHPFSSFAEQRNWAIDNTELKNPWVLMLDADEVVTEDFVTALKQEVSSAEENVVALRTCRKTMLDGTWLKYSDGFPVWIMRITRVGKAQYEDSGHGEVPVPKLDGEIGTLHEPFLHYPFSKGMEDWHARHERYSTREAKLEFESLAPFKLSELFAADKAIRRRALRSLSRRLPGRAWLRFLYQYILKRGFLDGAAGLKFCRMMSKYEGMIVQKRKQLERE